MFVGNNESLYSIFFFLTLQLHVITASVCLVHLCLQRWLAQLPVCVSDTLVYFVAHLFTTTSHKSSDHRDRRCQSCQPFTSSSHDMSPSLYPISTQVSGLHAEEADWEPEGAVLCWGAGLQRVDWRESEEFGTDGWGRLYFQPAQQLLEGEATKYVFMFELALS